VKVKFVSRSLQDINIVGDLNSWGILRNVLSSRNSTKSW